VSSILQIQTPVHGRVLIEEPASTDPRGCLIGFHGYGQTADDMLTELRQIPGASDWRLVSVQALHRFYARDHQRVIASWMTKEDRDLAIADNVEYVDRVVAAIVASTGAAANGSGAAPLIVFLGFSQGASMAYRAALLGRHRASGVIALAGDIPSEVQQAPRVSLPPVLIGAGADDGWYDAAKVAADVELLTSRGVTPRIVRFAGGHEWTEEFRTAASEWLARVKERSRSV
jgi:predicted esterase